AVCPKPHKDAVVIVSDRLSSLSISSGTPSPSVILSKISNILFVPSLQGTHLPQDSSTVKSKKNLAISTIQLSSSITTIPPEPMIDPSCPKDSKSTGVSKYSVGIHPPEGPPVWIALNSLPLGMPPPISKIISLNVIP